VQVPLARQFPRSIRRVLQSSQLGSPQAVFVARAVAKPSLLPGLLCILFGLTLSGIFVYLYTKTILLSSWPLWQICIIPLLTLTWIIIGGWLIRSTRQPRGLMVILCTNGLLCYVGKPAAILWDEIVAYWKAIASSKEGEIEYCYTIRTRHGMRQVFTEELSDLAKLGAAIEHEVTRRLIPHCFVTYQAGQPVDFESIILTQQGIQLRANERILPWSEIQRVHFDDASVSIYKTDQFWDWATIPASTVANLAICKSLIEHILAERAGHARLADMLARYHASKPLTFGQLQLSINGLAYLERHLFIPWQEISAIGVGEQEIIIRRGDATNSIVGWHTIPLQEVTDVPLLRNLLNTIMNEHEL